MRIPPGQWVARRDATRVRLIRTDRRKLAHGHRIPSAAGRCERLVCVRNPSDVKRPVNRPSGLVATPTSERPSPPGAINGNVPTAAGIYERVGFSSEEAVLLSHIWEVSV